MHQELAASPKSLDHYRFNIRTLLPYTYMQMRGCKLDLQKVAEMKAETWMKIQRQQQIVNHMTGSNFNV
jgi:hypothetical protein